ncbi:alternative ribosome rescue aminoacyl-tRNA hydrolase ArfB [Arthrobacter sp. JCM 19049]|uniref:alternative ribosome rescue aminoacyl-tRNA hydrolase ArfB n=1 Tax=Arthrobacter sp. JCM 19049 TaxID=1460643 RepID=UPI0035B5335C
MSIPAVELEWRFSRASGPGGQHVNTSSTRVELSWNIAASHTLSPGQRERLLERLSSRLTDGSITVSAAEQRSQLLNRRSAQKKLGQIIAAALAPDPPKRRQRSQRRDPNAAAWRPRPSARRPSAAAAADAVSRGVPGQSTGVPQSGPLRCLPDSISSRRSVGPCPGATGRISAVGRWPLVPRTVPKAFQGGTPILLWNAAGRDGERE